MPRRFPDCADNITGRLDDAAREAVPHLALERRPAAGQPTTPDLRVAQRIAAEHFAYSDEAHQKAGAFPRSPVLL